MGEPVEDEDDPRKRSLANLRPWPKGVSGNPGGQSKIEQVKKTITAELRELLDGEVLSGKRIAVGKTLRQVLAAKLLELAILDGDLKSIKEVLDRDEGKAIARVAGPDGEAFKIYFDIDIEKV